MICNGCNRHVPIENKDTGLCASCNKESRDDRNLYPEIRKQYLEMSMRVNSFCPVKGTPITMESDIHHMKGRTGFADEWARENDISLLIDVRFFLAVSREGHQYIELNQKEALQRGWTLTRQDTHNG